MKGKSLKNKKKLLWMTFILLACLIIGGYALIQSILHVPSSGVVLIGKLGIFSDSACTSPLTKVDWGTLRLNSTYSQTAYLKNLGNTPLLLSMNTSDYNPPEAQNFLSLTWNLEGTTISPDQVLEINFTLQVGSGDCNFTDFTFLINIIGIES